MLLLSGAAPPLGAQLRQGITGYVLEEGTRRPVQGAFVALLDLSGRRVGGTLSHDDGRFVLGAPRPGRYRLQAERIGFRSVPSDEVTVPRGQLVHLDLEATAQAVELTGIEVGGDRRCDLGDTRGRATMALWEEARKALQVARWTQDEERFTYVLRSWDRSYEPRGHRVLDERIRRSTHVGRQAFRALAPEALEDGGYVVGSPAEGYDFYAPDAEILLSDSFLRTHCFQAVRSDGRLGLRFEPVPDRELPDVRGTLWMARGSTRLERLEFRYVNVPELDGSGVADQVGGEVRFEELSGGQWIVRWWEIRMPVLTRSPAVDGRAGSLQVAEMRAQGGEVEDVRNGGGEPIGEAREAAAEGIEPGPAAEGFPRLQARGDPVRVGVPLRSSDVRWRLTTRRGARAAPSGCARPARPGRRR